jgi:hypothetical protein
MYPVSVWDRRDSEGNECELHKVAEDEWQLSMSEGRWSGYPYITLHRKDLKDLFDAIGNEINAF